MTRGNARETFRACRPKPLRRCLDTVIEGMANDVGQRSGNLDHCAASSTSPPSCDQQCWPAQDKSRPSEEVRRTVFDPRMRCRMMASRISQIEDKRRKPIEGHVSGVREAGEQVVARHNMYESRHTRSSKFDRQPDGAVRKIFHAPRRRCGTGARVSVHWKGAGISELSVPSGKTRFRLIAATIADRSRYRRTAYRGHVVAAAGRETSAVVPAAGKRSSRGKAKNPQVPLTV